MQQVLTFTLNDMNYGIPVEAVEAIENRLDIVTVPGGPANVRGIIRLHGEIIPIYSLAKRFNCASENTGNLIIAGIEGMKVGLEVGQVHEIMNVEDRDILPMPEIMNAEQNCFHSVASCQKKLIVILSPDLLLTREEREGMHRLLEDQEH